MLLSPQRLGLIRHGATAWTLEGRYQGRADLPLCDEGLAEAGALAETLKSCQVSRIVTSPLRRARQTADHLAALTGLPAPRIDENLVEIDYGNWEGLTQPEVKSKWPDLLRQWKRAPETVRFPGGETLGEVKPRVRAALAAWRGAGQDEVIVLVTHAVWMKLAWLETGSLPAPVFRHIVLPTGKLFWFSSGGLTQSCPFNDPTRSFNDKEFSSCE